MEGKCFDAGIIVAGGKYSAVLVDEVMMEMIKRCFLTAGTESFLDGNNKNVRDYAVSLSAFNKIHFRLALFSSNY